MRTLILAEHGDGFLKPANLHAVTAAAKIGHEVDMLLLGGENVMGAAEQAAKIPGLSKILVATHSAYAHLLAENVAQLIVKVSGNYTHILACATSVGKNILPRAAALLDVQQISEISDIEAADTFVRPIYAGNALASVQSSDRIKLITIRMTAFDAAPGEGGQAQIEEVHLAEDLGLSVFLGQELSKSERPELTSARIVISGGRGMASGENFKLLDNLADKLHAAVGASRAAVDAGFVPNDYQVGQTGKIVAPDLYIAVGISGAIQHLAGMKDSKVIVAINKDEEAPIFQIADYGLVGDLFTIIPELTAELSK